MKVKIGWVNLSNQEEIQIKKFNDEMSAIQWCREHRKNISLINDTRFKLCYLGIVSPVKEVGHFEIMDALNR
ncbi:MAG: hypothetical protein IKN54_07260 [Lachnospiraceae bacterium]|nr:hypothetical protein [Lachnospiraceae bacterium]